MPKTKQLDTESNFGKGVFHMNSVEISKTMYGATWCDFPAQIKKVPIKTIVDSSCDDAVANLDGKLVGGTDIKLGDHPGREIRVDVDGGQLLFGVRVYLVGQRL